MKRLAFLLLVVAGNALAQYTPPANTGFLETFGNYATHPVLCPDGSTTGCVQPWSVTQGSAASVSIVNSSTCGTGAPDTKAVKLSAAATAVAIKAEGTIPYVKQSTGQGTVWTLYFCYDSTTVPAFAGLFTLKNDAGGNGLNSYWSSSGSGQIYWDGNTAVADGVNAWHKVVITQANGAGASSVAIDGTTLSTFTMAATDWNNLILTGNTTGQANVYWDSTTLTGFTGGFPPTEFADWAGQSGTVTAANMAAGIHCGQNQSGNYTTSGSAVTFSYVATSGNAFSNPISVCGASYTNNSNVAMRATWNATATSTTISRTINTTYGQGSTGTGITWTIGSISAFTQIDFYSISTHFWYQLCGSSDGATCGVGGSNTTVLFCAEQSNPAQHTCSNLGAVTTGKLWITGVNTSTGSDTIKAYNWSGGLGSLIGTYSLSDTGFNGAITKYYGDSGASAPGTTVTIDYWGEITDATGTFPLLPPTSSGGGCSLALLGVGSC